VQQVPVDAFQDPAYLIYILNRRDSARLPPGLRIRTLLFRKISDTGK
jgi:hypothetical protein